ncbi:MAG: glucosamine-6-phosphate deaminase [Propionibacteriaceae bacterium]|nr:glucosamine-6-phosphate deaminase [Micropruina sp.]
MEVIIAPNAHQVGVVAAAKAARIAGPIGPKVVLGVATGSSPVQTFAELARLVDSGALDLSEASAFALDEYVGMQPDNPLSYHEVIRQTITVPLHLDPARVHVPEGAAKDLGAACQAYEEAITAAGGVDIQFLGIGSNGHIGFNEPSSSLASRTRVKTLAASTRQDNARFFNSLDEVPQHCLTQGLGTILDARHVILVATGLNKADAVANMVEGPVTSMCPGSALQLHANAVIVVDEDAASKLSMIDYYREIYANLPDEQRLDI